MLYVLAIAAGIVYLERRNGGNRLLVNLFAVRHGLLHQYKVIGAGTRYRFGVFN